MRFCGNCQSGLTDQETDVCADGCYYATFGEKRTTLPRTNGHTRLCIALERAHVAYTDSTWGNDESPSVEVGAYRVWCTYTDSDDRGAFLVDVCDGDGGTTGDVRLETMDSDAVVAFLKGAK